MSCAINYLCHSFDIPPCIMCVSFADYIHILAQEGFFSFTAKAPPNHRTIRRFCNTIKINSVAKRSLFDCCHY